MKKLTFLLLFSYLMTFSMVFSQEENMAFKSNLPNEASEMKLLLHTEFFNSNAYRFYDDPKTISEINLYSILKTVPQNKLIVRDAIAWRIVSLATSGFVGGCFGLMLAKHHTGTLTEEGKIFFSSGILTGGIACILSDTLFRYKFDKAIDNYNLYVMGIPIK